MSLYDIASKYVQEKKEEELRQKRQNFEETIEEKLKKFEVKYVYFEGGFNIKELYSDIKNYGKKNELLPSVDGVARAQIGIELFVNGFLEKNKYGNIKIGQSDADKFIRENKDKIKKEDDLIKILGAYILDLVRQND